MRRRGGLAGIWCVLGLFGIALLMGGAPGAAAAAGPGAPSTAPAPPPADLADSFTLIYPPMARPYRLSAGSLVGFDYGWILSAVEIRGSQGSLTASATGIPLAWGWANGTALNGTGSFSLKGKYDATTGVVTGTFTFEDTGTGTSQEQGYANAVAIDWAETFSGDVKGTIGSETASLIFNGKRSPKCTMSVGQEATSCWDFADLEDSVPATFTVQATAASQPMATPEETATPVEEPEETPAAEPTETPTVEPCVEGARFTSLSREVEFRHEAEKDNWHPAKPDTILCVGDHVRTSEDSSAIIGFADLSTFLLKAESEIVVTLPPATDSKLQLLLGNIWVNVKKMAHNGTMEVEMSQAVAGIKGTTFVLSETGTTSTLKVIEGTVSFTAKTTGQTVEVSTGQTVQADKTGLSPVTSFDVNAESADWAKLGAETGTGADSGLPVALLAGLAGLVVVLLVAGIFVMARRRGRRPLPAQDRAGDHTT